MAKKSLIAKAKRTPKFKVRGYHRCFVCGRPRAYLRRFALCRICFRERALLGELPGVPKSSWKKTDELFRSDRRHADPHPQRVPGAAHGGRRARLAHEARDC